MRLSEAQLAGIAALFAQCADYTPREEWGKFLGELRELKEHKKAPLAGNDSIRKER